VAKTHRRLPAHPKERQASQASVANSASPAWHLELAIWIGLILTVFAAYSEAGHFFFVTFDDPLYVTENAHVPAGLTLENLRWVMSAIVDTNWIPVTMISHMAACDAFGMKSGAHHWVNIVFHAMASVMLFVLLNRATRARWPSAFVAFIFALHPLHVESVAWISERKDVLSTFFWFLAAYAYVRYTEQPGVRRYVLMVVPLCLGLMAKPMLVTFPFTLLLLDVWPLQRFQFPKVVIEKVPLFALSAASSTIAYLVQQTGGAVQSSSLGDNIRNALASYVIYIRQMFWPSGLAMMYPHQSIPMWQAAAALIFLAGVSTLAVVTWRTKPYFATGWFWYLGTLVPVIGLVQVGIQSHADRYMYVPMIGLTIALAWGAADAIRKWPRIKVWVATAAGSCCLASLVAASAQAEYWRNSEDLYQHAINVTGDNYVAEYLLGEYLMDIPGRGADAVKHFEAALRIRPGSADARNSIGAYLLQNGRDGEARRQFEAALRIQPNSAEAHFNLGLMAEKNPNLASEAIAHYEAAVRARPDFLRARKSLGMLLLKLGRTAEALSQFVAVERVQPDPDIERLMPALRGVH
jgi:tetratricopeptide (TPR) repeat protein